MKIFTQLTNKQKKTFNTFFSISGKKGEKEQKT